MIVDILLSEELLVIVVFRLRRIYFSFKNYLRYS